MRYFTQMRGQKEAVAVEVEPLGEGRFALVVNGRRHEVDALVLEHKAVSLIVNGQSYCAEIEEREEEVGVLVQDHWVRIDVADERRRRLRAAKTGFAVEGRQTITAPMPGKVVKVLVRVGDEVKEGQGLVVVEAMKMENELKSPKAGKVTELFAKEGCAVENNAKLVTVE
jgi:biotin carboxyl carrier protein